jgi:hypothetical protein
MGSPRAKYYLNYDMRKLWCPEFMRGPSVPPVYPNLEPELAIARDWHSYRPMKEAWLMFGLGIGGLFGLAAVSAYDVTGYRARRPWVSAACRRIPRRWLGLLPARTRLHPNARVAAHRAGDAVGNHACGV